MFGRNAITGTDPKEAAALLAQFRVILCAGANPPAAEDSLSPQGKGVERHADARHGYGQRLHE